MNAYDMNDAGARSLCAAICTRAVRDYFDIREVADGKRARAPQGVTAKELKKFFESEWGNDLFRQFGMNAEGALRIIKQSYEDGSYKEKLESSKNIQPKGAIKE